MVHAPPAAGSIWDVSLTYIVVLVLDIVYFRSTSHWVFRGAQLPVALVMRTCWPLENPCGPEQVMVVGPPDPLGTAVAVPHFQSSMIAWPNKGIATNDNIPNFRSDRFIVLC